MNQVVTEIDWATQKATRIIKGFRIVGGRGHELREDIAKALRKVESETRLKMKAEAEVEVEPVQEAAAPDASHILLINERSYGGQVFFEAIGFKDIEEAHAWSQRWELSRFGYSPIANPQVLSDGSITVFCKVWTSCD
jgi:hypothetical protein